MLSRLKAWWLVVLPHHLISRLVLWLTRREWSLVTVVVRRFARIYNVDMADAAEPDLAQYRSFNAFFTRALKPAARPIASEALEVACPADGCISALGEIDDERILQAKGIDYSLVQLIGGDADAAQRLRHGRFITVYLSPRDYHRLHMPLSGRLIRQTHVPGRLFSVGPDTVNNIGNLFTRNERVIAQFDTDHGLMVLVLVGAINVAAIETVWHGLVTPPQRSAISHIDYVTDAQSRFESRLESPLKSRSASGLESRSGQSDKHTTPGATSGIPSITLHKGEEMGRFNMGSTVIALFENEIRWQQMLETGTSVRMGQSLGEIV